MNHPRVRIKTSIEMGLGNQIAISEDGMRTSAKSGNYEWWYFDSKFPDGSSLVIVFYTKPVTSMKGKLEPYVSLHYLGADGTEIHTKARSQDFHFSRDACDVKIGDCHVSDDLKQYSIHFQNEEVNLENINRFFIMFVSNVFENIKGLLQKASFAAGPIFMPM